MAGVAWPFNETGSTGAPAVTARQLRQQQSAFVAMGTAARPLGAKSGIRVGTPSTVVSITGSSPYTWNAGGFGGVIDGEANVAAGPYTYSFETADTGTIAAAGAAARVDRLDVQISDSDEGDGSGTKSVAVIYTQGAATGGVAPAAPARSHRLALINVPTSGAPTVQWAPDWCGGPWTFNTFADMKAYSDGLTAANVPVTQGATVIADTTAQNNRSYVWGGTTWVAQGNVWETATYHDTSPTGLNAGDTITTMALPALPYATVAKIDASGEMGNLSGTGANPYYLIIASAGTLTIPSTGGPSVVSSGWGHYSVHGELSIPANTAVTLTLQQQSTQNKTIAKGSLVVRVVGA